MTACCFHSFFMFHSHMNLLPLLCLFLSLQQLLARESAEQSAQKRVALTEADRARMQQAEQQMQLMINRVQQETVNVQQAVQDLQQAQAQLELDPLVQLRKGGIVKQGALAGLVLFTVRSIIDTVGAFSDEALLPAAILQGFIAMVCAAIFLWIK
jgi:hypothetical protein